MNLKKKIEYDKIIDIKNANDVLIEIEYYLYDYTLIPNLPRYPIFNIRSKNNDIEFNISFDAYYNTPLNYIIIIESEEMKFKLNNLNLEWDKVRDQYTTLISSSEDLRAFLIYVEMIGDNGRCIFVNDYGANPSTSYKNDAMSLKQYIAHHITTSEDSFNFIDIKVNNPNVNIKIRYDHDGFKSYTGRYLFLVKYWGWTEESLLPLYKLNVTFDAYDSSLLSIFHNTAYLDLVQSMIKSRQQVDIEQFFDILDILLQGDNKDIGNIITNIKSEPMDSNLLSSVLEEIDEREERIRILNETERRRIAEETAILMKEREERELEERIRKETERIREEERLAIIKLNEEERAREEKIRRVRTAKNKFLVELSEIEEEYLYHPVEMYGYVWNARTFDDDMLVRLELYPGMEELPFPYMDIYGRVYKNRKVERMREISELIKEEVEHRKEEIEHIKTMLDLMETEEEVKALKLPSHPECLIKKKIDMINFDNSIEYSDKISILEKVCESQGKLFFYENSSIIKKLLMFPYIRGERNSMERCVKICTEEGLVCDEMQGKYIRFKPISYNRFGGFSADDYYRNVIIEYTDDMDQINWGKVIQHNPYAMLSSDKDNNLLEVEEKKTSFWKDLWYNIFPKRINVNNNLLEHKE